MDSVKCLERKVMQNYYTICFDCSTADGICAKCGKESDDIDR